MKYRTIAIALCCVLAGCGGIGGQTTPQPSSTPSVTDVSATPSPTDSPSPTPTPTVTEAPYGSEENPITVAFRADEDARNADYSAIVEQSISLYERDGDWMTGRELNFKHIDDTADADLVIVFSPAVRRCNGETTELTFYWCTDGTISDSQYNQAVIRIPSRFRNDGISEMLNAGIAFFAGVENPDEVTMLDYDPNAEYAYHDPWPGKGPVTVSINNSVAPDRSLVPLVRDTLDYWEGAEAQYGDYQVDWKLEPDNPDADVEVRYVNSIDRCGQSVSEEFIGCASILEPTVLAYDKEIVRVGAGYTDETIRKILRHEFGHLYGRTHGEEPMPIMSETQETELLAQPNASTKPYAFEETPLEIYINYSSFDAPDSQVRGQIEHAVDYYNNHGGEYRPEYAKIEFTRDTSEAEVFIRADSNYDCGDLSACSDLWYYGTDVDGDGAYETYTSMTITLSELDLETYGWHVGYWLEFAYPTYDVPPPFHSDADYDERRNWWK